MVVVGAVEEMAVGLVVETSEGKPLSVSSLAGSIHPPSHC